MSTVEADVELKTSALTFLEIFSTKTYELPSIDPTFLQSIEIISGERGTAGFVILVNYTLKGTAYVAKVEIESINFIAISITFSVVEGDLLEEYKSIKFIIKVTPNTLQGSVVHCTIQHEKLNEEVSDRNALLQEIVELSKQIDAYLSSLL